MITMSIEKTNEFWSYVDSSGGEDSCWEWMGSRLKSGGYGRFRVERGEDRRLRAHRISLCLATGVPYDSPLVAMHSCDNPPCVNPNHLAWGTQRENIQDAKRKGRATNGGKTHTLRLTDQEILGIVDAVSRGFSLLETSKMFQCSKVYVDSICRGTSKRANALLDFD